MSLIRILVLDDDPTVGQILCMGATALGHEALLCDTVPAFLEAVGSWSPTHVAIDLTLPGTSGVEVIRQLASTPARPSVIVCSGAGSFELEAALGEARALALPVAGALPKPFRLAQVRQLLAPP
jgi:DNA-binding response OmpR family regulator